MNLQNSPSAKFLRPRLLTAHNQKQNKKYNFRRSKLIASNHNPGNIHIHIYTHT